MEMLIKLDFQLPNEEVNSSSNNNNDYSNKSFLQIPKKENSVNKTNQNSN